jgi:hypothetical protein
MRKAAPVEYVRVCTAHGAGFFYIPGTDTCLRIGGRARAEYHFSSQNSRSTSYSGYNGLARVSFDARTSTAYGTLRTFVRLDFAHRTGVPQLKSGSAERQANAFFSNSPDGYNQIQKFVNVDSAFVQFAGFTAGRANSFFDFYTGQTEMISGGMYSTNGSAINLFAYTATFGGGFSATISAEDPTNRRMPVFYQGVVGAANGAAGAGVPPASQQGGVNFITSATPVAFLGTSFTAGGVPVTAVSVDTTQRFFMPDFVGALRYDGAWGSAQLSAAVHEIKIGGLNPAAGPNFLVGAGVGGPVAAPRIPDAAYGWAVQGGVKVNLPMIAPGDQLWLQGAYAQGAGAYTGVTGPGGWDLQGASLANKFTYNQNDAVIDGRGGIHLTEFFSVSGALLHYWSPEWRSAVFGSYGQTNYDPRLRNANFGPAGITSTVTPGVGGAPATAVTTATVAATNSTLMSWDIMYAGGNLIWSPVRDLDIGVEVIYQRVNMARPVANREKPGTLTTFDDQIFARFRVQRDF